jgi:hypothetical protein
MLLSEEHRWPNSCLIVQREREKLNWGNVGSAMTSIEKQPLNMRYLAAEEGEIALPFMNTPRSVLFKPEYM